MSNYLPYNTGLFPYFNSDQPKGIDSFFDDFFEKLSPNTIKNKSFDFVPSMDLHETENKLEVLVEVPGVNKKDLSVDIKDGILTISGKKEKLVKDAKYQEISSGSFERSIKLSKSYDTNSISVTLNNSGLLRIEILKKAEEAKKSIEIKSE